jgi:hypothetical protein
VTSQRTLPTALAPYRLDESLLTPAGRGFALAIADCDFQRAGSVEQTIANHRKIGGLYLWLVRHVVFPRECRQVVYAAFVIACSEASCCS